MFLPNNARNSEPFLLADIHRSVLALTSFSYKQRINGFINIFNSLERNINIFQFDLPFPSEDNKWFLNQMVETVLLICNVFMVHVPCCRSSIALHFLIKVMRNIFLKNSYTKCGGETIPRLFKSKLSISLDQ